MNSRKCVARVDMGHVQRGHRLADHWPDEFDAYLAGRQVSGLSAEDAIDLVVAKVRHDYALD